jgi:NitT/TauT family transport system ATP-binding protein
LISVRSLTRDYSGGRGVFDVSFDLSPGESCSIIGPSGCGKTTLLHMLCGLEPPDGGDIRPVPGSGIRPGLVQQRDALYPWLTGLENVLLARPRQRPRGIELLERLGIDHCAQRYPAAMSGGERQRVSLARTLITDPGVLLLDEPSTALDEFTREDLQDLILEVQSSAGIAAIYVTHSIEEALFLSSRVLIMSDGRIAGEYANGLYPDPRARDTREFYRGVIELRSLFQELTA